MASVSGLLKSASSIRSQLATYQDQVMAFDYANSGYTDSAYGAYSAYLKSRIDALQASGSVANASKAVTLMGTLRGAMNNNVSASISNMTDQIMRGNATPQDKYNLIISQIDRAYSTGDQTLVDKLVNQADSLSQTIQYQEQVAQENAISYAKAQGASEDSVATQLEAGLKQLNADVAAGGMAKFNDAAQQWVSANKDKLLAIANSPSSSPDTKAAIEKAVNSSQPNYQDIIAGVTNALITVHTMSANIVAPYDPAEAMNYMGKANGIANGTSKVSTLAGDLTAQDVMTWQQQPGMFIPHENTTGGKLEFSYKSASLQNGESAISGYQYDQSGNLVPVFTGSENGHIVTQQEADSINKQLTQLGLSFKQIKAGDNLSNGIAVQFNDVNQDGVKLPQWLKDVTFGQKNLTTQMYVTDKGLQFGTLDSAGSAHGFLIAHDNNGLGGLYKAENVNGQLTFRQQNAPGEYGFNQSQNSVVQDKPQSVLDSVVKNVSAFMPNTQQSGFNAKPNAGGLPAINNPLAIRNGAPMTPTMTQRMGGGYNFSYGGQAISAARYAQLTNTPFRTLLQNMATGGDTGAQTALGFVGNDYGYDPTKAASYQNSSLYNSLTWGVQGVKAAPANAPASVLGNGAQLSY